MTCKHCVSADKLFDQKTADKQLRKFNKKGPDKETAQLLKLLKNENLMGLSLLDIGGGIGAIPLSLIPRGISNIQGVDASKSYLDITKTAIENSAFKGNATFHFGDFSELAGQVNTADIVTLDKVLCCYPNMDLLLTESLSKCKKYFGIVIPKDNWIARIFISFLNFGFWISKNPFRVFIHPTLRMEKIIYEQGFNEIASGKTMAWRVRVFKKAD